MLPEWRPYPGLHAVWWLMDWLFQAHHPIEFALSKSDSENADSKIYAAGYMANIKFRKCHLPVLSHGTPGFHVRHK